MVLHHKRRLEGAIATATSSGLPLTFDISLRPYQLDASLPIDAGSKRARYIKKFGADRMTMIEQRMKEVGAAEGINFSYDGPIGSSFDSMRLLKLAEAGGESKLGMRGRHMRLKEELGKAYFENEKSLADTEVLVACAVKVGMEEKEVRRFLASDEGVEGVSSALQEAHGEGVTGVPFFVINDRFRVSGAQESESFLQIFQKIAREGKGVAGADGRL